jgi:hypothetical protein
LWLATLLKDGGFGNNIEVRVCMTYTSASNLDELVENMMLGGHIFFPGYSGKELERAKSIFTMELQRLRTFQEVEDGVRIGMKAWIWVGWKKCDEREVPA